MNWQLFDALGIFMGFTANLVVSWTGHLSWRFQLASACIPAGCLMTLIWTIPESPVSTLDLCNQLHHPARVSVGKATWFNLCPKIWLFQGRALTTLQRWLLKKGKRAEAFASLCALRPTHLQAATELFYVNSQIQAEVSLFHQEKQSQEKPNLDAEAQHVENAHVDANADADETIDPNVFQDEFKSTNYWSRIYRLFTNPRSRRAAIAASVVMLSQQLCGV